LQATRARPPKLATSVNRCPWAATDPLLQSYHDREWGRPVRDDRRLFEFLVLEGAQAGLSWITILRKRDTYRRAFADFDYRRIARFGHADVARLLRDTGIVRNRAKIEAAIANARAMEALVAREGSFQRYVWRFVGDRPKINAFRAGRVPYTSPEAEALSHDLRKRGFRFVGPGVCYAFMQACGLVNDHVVGCSLQGRRLAPGSGSRAIPKRRHHRPAAAPRRLSETR
jgi:DNA-3-methyladenine glycosylase I